jgi:hypothetical protein
LFFPINSSYLLPPSITIAPSQPPNQPLAVHACQPTRRRPRTPARPPIEDRCARHRTDRRTSCPPRPSCLPPLRPPAASRPRPPHASAPRPPPADDRRAGRSAHTSASAPESPARPSPAAMAGWFIRFNNFLGI